MKKLLLALLLAFSAYSQDINYARIRRGPGLSVDAYGADPSGVRDSSAAFAAAFTAAASLPNGAVTCNGTYNMGTTNLTVTAAQGGALYSPTTSGCKLNWTSGATGYAITIGSASATTYLWEISGIRLITASTSQHLIRGIRTHELKLHNLELEGPGNATDTNDCITLDSKASDSIYTDIDNVNCNHVKRGIVSLSVGSLNRTTTINAKSLKVLGPGPQGTKKSGSVGVDYGASGNGDGDVYIGGNLENLENGFVSSGGAGLAMHGILVNGMRFEDVTCGANLEQFSFDNKFIGNGALFKICGAGAGQNGNIQLGNSGLNAAAPPINTLNSTLSVNPGLAATGNKPQVGVSMVIPTTSTFPIENNQLDTGSQIVYQKNASGMFSNIGSNPTLWTTFNGVPTSANLGAKVNAGTYTSGGTVVGVAGQVCFLKFASGQLGGIATVTLTGTNTIASGTALNIIDGGYGFSGAAPTTATFLSGQDGFPSPSSIAASCSSTAGGVTVATTLGTTGGHLVANINGGQGSTLYVGEGSVYNLVPTKNPSLQEITVAGLRGALYDVSSHITYFPNTGNAALKWISTDGAAATGSWSFQPGNFSAAQGGALHLYQAANGSHPGDVAIGCGSSTAKFRVNSSGIDNGSDMMNINCQNGQISLYTVTTFANLGTPTKGTMMFCADCNVATPCTGGGSGAWAFRTAAPAWTCPF